MKTCVIFCAAEFDELIRPIEATDHVIAADGGLQHTRKLQLTPDEILGDFDSLGYTPEGANVFPVEKDDTDAMLAVRRGLDLGYRYFLIYGGMDGPRLDHTVANFQTLHFLAREGAMGMLVGHTYIATVLLEGSIRFPAGLQGGISVFCAGADAAGVDIRGLYYTLENGNLSAAFPLGVSNHFTGQEALIRVKEGALLILWERSCGLPTEGIQQGRDVMVC